MLREDYDPLTQTPASAEEALALIDTMARGNSVVNGRESLRIAAGHLRAAFQERAEPSALTRPESPIERLVSFAEKLAADDKRAAHARWKQDLDAVLTRYPA